MVGVMSLDPSLDRLLKKSFGVRRLSVRLKLHAAAHGAANTRPAADDARQHAGAGRPSPIAFCLNDACGHQAIIDVSSYPADTPPALVPNQGEVRKVWRSRK